MLEQEASSPKHAEIRMPFEMDNIAVFMFIE